MSKNKQPFYSKENLYGIPYLKDPAEMSGIYAIRDVDLNTIHSFGRVACVYDCPSQTGVFQRLFLFGLVVAKQPKRLLELGFKFGGTSFVMLCALQDLGNNGKLVALDPCPEPGLDFSQFGDSFYLYRGASPDDVRSAVQVLDGKIDLCHIDADHEYDSVLADLSAVKEYMNEDSYILMHDACFPDVKKAIQEFVKRHPNEIVDCGLIDPFPNEEGWGGMHLLRVVRPKDTQKARKLLGSLGR